MKILSIIVFSIAIILIISVVHAEENESNFFFSEKKKFDQKEKKNLYAMTSLTESYANILQRNKKSEVFESETRDFLEVDSR